MSVSCAVHVCEFFSLWFPVFVNNDGGFRIFLRNAFYGFSGVAKEITPHSGAKTVVPRDHLQLGECMTSLVSLAAVIWVITASKKTKKI